MIDPGDRTYPTIVTSTFASTRTQGRLTTVDQITILDNWTTSPDPTLVPYTMVQTETTQRTVSAAGAEPTMTVLNSTTTWIVWTVSAFDMPPYQSLECPGPDGCAYGTIKPNYLCDEMRRETRCAAQCELRDWLWWCRADGGINAPIGRVCSDGNQTDYKMLLEPCDHTDFKSGCQVCPGYERDWESYGVK